ncbi:hypothetical protein CKO51_29020 [Rhodopirellula sp. SM50]|nr:hypothetical protein CKO51_29020 [Rhodopirellula sp. SM50]
MASRNGQPEPRFSPLPGKSCRSHSEVFRSHSGPGRTPASFSQDRNAGPRENRSRPQIRKNYPTCDDQNGTISCLVWAAFAGST